MGWTTQIRSTYCRYCSNAGFWNQITTTNRIPKKKERRNQDNYAPRTIPSDNNGCHVSNITNRHSITTKTKHARDCCWAASFDMLVCTTNQQQSVPRTGTQAPLNKNDTGSNNGTNIEGTQSSSSSSSSSRIAQPTHNTRNVTNVSPIRTKYNRVIICIKSKQRGLQQEPGKTRKKEKTTTVTTRTRTHTQLTTYTCNTKQNGTLFEGGGR